MKTVRFDLSHLPAEAWRLLGTEDTKLLRPWLTREPDDGGEHEMRCPLHDDRRPSGSVNFSEGVWVCRAGCGGGHVGELALRMASGTEGTAPELSRLKKPKPGRPLPSEAQVAGWHSALSHDSATAQAAREWLERRRGISPEMWRRFRLGVDGHRVTVPVYDGDELVNARWLCPFYPHCNLGCRKGVVTSRTQDGKNHTRHLFPSAEHLPDEGRVFIVEGEPDALLLWSWGYPAFTCIGGADVLPKVVADNADLFADRDVVVWTDAGEAGEKARRGVTEALEDAASVVVLGVDGRPDGWDVTDAWRERGRGFGEWLDVKLARATGETPRPYRLASSVQPEPVDWLWHGRLPLAHVSILEGDPGGGKSTMTLDIAARVSRGGEMPDGATVNAAGVVLVGDEDRLEDTIVPRLMAHGADLERVASVSLPRENGHLRPLVIPDDLARIHEAARDTEAALVVIDPITAYLPESVNSHNDASVRRALTPLAEFAHGLGAAVLLVRHLNKSGEMRAMYRGGGSIAFIGLARSGLVVAEHPDHPGLMVVAQVKSNLARAVPSITYRLETSPEYDAPLIVWEGEDGIGADMLLQGSDARLDAPVREEAESLLTEVLADGPVAVASIREEARMAGLSWRTVERAKGRLDVRAERERDENGRTTSWTWALPFDVLTVGDEG